MYKETLFRNYVDSLLKEGAIDEPDYVETLTSEEYEDLLVNTWMQDKEIIEDFNELYKEGVYYE